MEINKIYNEDCLEGMKRIDDRSIDCVITDPPYGTTACSWDTMIPFNRFLMLPRSARSKELQPVYRDEYILRELKVGRDYAEICGYFDEKATDGMWQHLERITKPNGAIVLFGSEPFSSALRVSNLKMYKYDWIWDKITARGHLVAKKVPMKQHELISIFYSKHPNYNPQMTLKSKPQKGSNTESSRTSICGGVTTLQKQQVVRTHSYPKTIQTFGMDKRVGHPTQKPVKLIEYLIKTYTNEGDLVLDFTIGSGTTAVACKQNYRNYIGFETDQKYYKIACERVRSVNKDLLLA